MTLRQFSLALNSFVETINAVFDSHFTIEETDLSYRVITRDSCLTKYVLSFLPSGLISMANFDVVDNCIEIVFLKPVIS